MQFETLFTVRNAHRKETTNGSIFPGTRVKCELRVAKLQVGIVRVEVRAKRASI